MACARASWRASSRRATTRASRRSSSPARAAPSWPAPTSREFGKPSQPPSLIEVIATLETSKKPTIAAVHGTPLGGGLELTMGCHFRVAAPGTRLGLPEIKLGLIPGAGGTQRLPRLVGIEKALPMILSGDPIPAKDALAAGLVDEIIEGDLVAGRGRVRPQGAGREAPAACA